MLTRSVGSRPYCLISNIREVLFPDYHETAEDFTLPFRSLHPSCPAPVQHQNLMNVQTCIWSASSFVCFSLQPCMATKNLVQLSFSQRSFSTEATSDPEPMHKTAKWPHRDHGCRSSTYLSTGSSLSGILAS